MYPFCGGILAGNVYLSHLSQAKQTTKSMTLRTTMPDLSGSGIGTCSHTACVGQSRVDGHMNRPLLR